MIRTARKRNYSCPKKMGEHIDDIVETINRNVPIEDAGVTITDGIGGVGRKISALPRGGGGGSTVTPEPRLFEISDDGTSTGKAKLVESTLAGGVPAGIAHLEVSDGDVIFGAVVFTITDNVITGVTSRDVYAFPTIFDDDPESATFYYRIGSVTVSGAGKVTGTNDVYGPIDATAYRNWFSFDPITFGVAWNATT